MFESCRDRQFFEASTASITRGELPMIAAIVGFKLPAMWDAAEVAEVFRNSAPKYQGLCRAVPGISRRTS
jgi:hypothetical protein